VIGWFDHVTGAGLSARLDWLSRTLTDRAGGGPEPGRRGARGGRRGEGARARVRVRERWGFLPSCPREPERFSRGKQRATGQSPSPSHAGPCKSGGQGWVGAGLGFASLGSPALGRMQSQFSRPPSLPRFPFSYPLMHLPILPTAATVLPTWQPRLRLCFPPGAMLSSAPSPGRGCGWWGGGVTGAGPGLRGRRWLPCSGTWHMGAGRKKKCNVTLAEPVGLELIIIQRLRAKPNS
jgi:hypothetical protein